VPAISNHLKFAPPILHGRCYRAIEGTYCYPRKPKQPFKRSRACNNFHIEQPCSVAGRQLPSLTRYDHASPITARPSGRKLALKRQQQDAMTSCRTSRTEIFGGRACSNLHIPTQEGHVSCCFATAYPICDNCWLLFCTHAAISGPLPRGVAKKISVRMPSVGH